MDYIFYTALFQLFDGWHVSAFLVIINDVPQECRRSEQPTTVTRLLHSPPFFGGHCQSFYSHAAFPLSSRPCRIDCAVCSEGYTAQLGFTCRDCSDSTGGIIVATVLGVAALFVAVVVVSYVVSGEVGDKGHRFAVHLKRHIPLQSVKIVIVAWQILTQVRANHGQQNVGTIECRMITTRCVPL